MVHRLISKILGSDRMMLPWVLDRSVCSRHAIGSGLLYKPSKFDQLLILEVHMRTPSGAGGEAFAEDMIF